MARKPSPKKSAPAKKMVPMAKGAPAKRKGAPPAFGKKPKIPALGGSGLMGLGATGSQGMRP